MSNLVEAFGYKVSNGLCAPTVGEIVLGCCSVLMRLCRMRSIAPYRRLTTHRRSLL